MGLIELIIFCLVVGVIMQLLPLDARVKQVIYVLLVLVVILALLGGVRIGR